MQTSNMQKDFDQKRSGEYHGLYVQSDTLLLADVFNNFQNVCLKMYETALKKTKVELKVGIRGIRGIRICVGIRGY